MENLKLIYYHLNSQLNVIYFRRIETNLHHRDFIMFPQTWLIKATKMSKWHKIEQYNDPRNGPAFGTRD